MGVRKLGNYTLASETIVMSSSRHLLCDYTGIKGFSYSCLLDPLTIATKRSSTCLTPSLKDRGSVSSLVDTRSRRTSVIATDSLFCTARSRRMADALDACCISHGPNNYQKQIHRGLLACSGFLPSLFGI